MHKAKHKSSASKCLFRAWIQGQFGLGWTKGINITGVCSLVWTWHLDHSSQFELAQSARHAHGPARIPRRADGQSGPSQRSLPDAAAAAGSGKAAKTKGGNTTKKGGGKSDGGEPCSNCGTLGATSRCSQCRQTYYCGKACFKVRGCASVGG